MNDHRVTAISQTLLETTELGAESLRLNEKKPYRLAILQHYLTQELCKCDGEHLVSAAQTSQTDHAMAAYQTVISIDQCMEKVPSELQDAVRSKFLADLAARTLIPVAVLQHF